MKSPSGIEKFGKDEVDAFHDARDFVAIDTSARRGDQDDASSEDEGVLALKGDDESSSSSSDSSSSEEEEEEDKVKDERPNGNAKNAGESSEDSSSSASSSSDDDDDDDDDGEDDEEDTMGSRAIGWGTKRSTFYAKDDASDVEDSEEEELNVQEALNQQKERSKNLKSKDFQIDSDEDDEDDDDNDDDDDDDVSSSDEDDGPEVERIARNASKISAEEKLERLKSEAPELLGLLADFKTKSIELQNTITPVLERVKSGKLATEKGVDYLEVKHHLLLNYCINLTFYLYMKAKGRSVKGHPVIKQLVRLRTIMEKLQPVDKKLRRQLDRLLSAPSAKTNVEAENDPMRFAPNVGDFEDSSDDDDEDDADHGVYRAPRLAATPYDADESKAEREERKKEAREARLRKSAVLRELHEEWSEQPQQQSTTGTDAATGNEDLEQWQRDRRRYEEENYTRLVPDKKRRKQIKAAKRAMNSAAFGALTDFGDIEQLHSQTDADRSEIVASAEKSAALHRHINQIEQQRRQRRKRGVTSGDADFIADPEALEERRRRQNERAADLLNGRERHFGGGEFDEVASDDGRNFVAADAEDDFYKAAKVAQREKKRRRKEAYARAPMMTAAEDVVDGSRKASRMILKNRGLVPHRPRENRNPRIVRRKKYEKAKKRRVGQVRKMRTDEAHKYAGEASGIRGDISRSRKMME